MQTTSEAELRAFVGPRASYYLRVWAEAEQGRPRRINWAAFFGSGLWLAYRKMYGPLAIVIGVLLVETVVEDLIFLKVLGHPQVPRELTTLVTLLTSAAVGVFGNRWYHRHVMRGIEAVREVEPTARLAVLARRGGGSWLIGVGSLLGFLVVFALLYAIVTAVLAIPQPQF